MDDGQQSMTMGKRNYLFWKYPMRVRQHIQLDDVAEYSVTPSKYSDEIARIMIEFIPKGSTVVDATACVGGDAATLADTFAKVYAVEQNPSRFDMLVHNLSIMTSQSGRVVPVLGNFLDWWAHGRPEGEAIAAVYIDPPWENGCSLAGYSIWDVAATIQKSGCMVVLKLPPEFPIEMKTRAVAELTSTKGHKKMKIVVV